MLKRSKNISIFRWAVTIKTYPGKPLFHLVPCWSLHFEQFSPVVRRLVLELPALCKASFLQITKRCTGELSWGLQHLQHKLITVPSFIFKTIFLNALKTYYNFKNIELHFFKCSNPLQYFKIAQQKRVIYDCTVKPRFNYLRFNDIPGLTMGICSPNAKSFPV